MQVLCLSLPLFKVVFDLFLYNFSKWALLHQINPLLCEPGTRAINLMFSCPASTIAVVPLNTGIHFCLTDGKTFTMADLITLSVNPLWIRLIVILVLSFSLGLCSRHLLQLIRAKKIVKNILQQAFPCFQSIALPLKAALKKSKVLILSSYDVDVPCVVRRSIIFPQKLLNKLSKAEFEAIIVHELDHLRWRDSALRMVLKMVSAFFWWIPMKRWQSQLELTQELACDAKISKFLLSPIDLASAITKAARAAKANNLSPSLIYFAEKGRLLSRMKALIKPEQKRSLGIILSQTLLMLTLLTIIFFGQFWIF